MFANALSGINVATKSIGAISHNISNAASAGFKASTARFADVMSSSSRDTVAKGAVGNGAMMAGAAVNFTQGNLKTTGQALDLAITGQGMFVKFAGAEAVDFAAPGAGDLFFTRNGSFSLDRDNYLVDSGGRFVASVAGSKVQIPSGLETAFETDLYAPPPLEAPAGPLKIYRDAVAAADSPAAQEAALIAAGLGPADFTRDPALGVTSTAGASADLISAAKAQAYSDTNLGPLSAEVRFWTSEYPETLNAYEGLVAREAKEPEPKPAWMATEITRLATALTTALGARNLMIGTDLGTSIDAIDAQARAAGATEALAVAQAAYDAKVAGLTAQDQQTRGRLTLTAAGAARLRVPAGASLLLDPEGFGRTDMISGGTLNDLFETEKARLHDALGIGALRNALALWEPARNAYYSEVSYLTDLPSGNEFESDFDFDGTNVVKHIYEQMSGSIATDPFVDKLYQFAGGLTLTPEDSAALQGLLANKDSAGNVASVTALNKRVAGPQFINEMVKALEARLAPQPVDPDAEARPLMLKSPSYQRALELVGSWRAIVPAGQEPSDNFATRDFVSVFGDEVSRIARQFETEHHNQGMIDYAFTAENRAAYHARSLVKTYDQATVSDRNIFILLRGNEAGDVALSGADPISWADDVAPALQSITQHAGQTPADLKRKADAQALLDALPSAGPARTAYIKTKSDAIFKLTQRIENYQSSAPFDSLWGKVFDDIRPLGEHVEPGLVDLYQAVSRRIANVETGRVGYERVKTDYEIAKLRFDKAVADFGDGSTAADGWNLQGHKLTLRAEGALGAKLALTPAEVADTTEGAISFAGGRIWKGLGEVQGFGAVAAEIGRVVKAAQTLTGSMMEVALGFVAPRPLPADPLADPPVAPDPIDPRITREDVNGIFALAGVSMSRLAEEARKGSVEGEAPIDLILRADLVQPTGGTLARTATRLGFDETLEAPPTRDLLSALEVTTDGRIFATYGGGSATAQPEPVAQLAVAFFANPALLTQVGGGDFRRSATSGPPEVRALGEAAGTQIRSGVLEMANVDLTEELVQMLKFQQMFQSASKAMQGDVDSVAKVLEVR